MPALSKPLDRGRGLDLPRRVLVRQRFPASPAVDVAEVLAAGLRPLAARLRPGAQVAVGVGSRGMDRLAEIVRTSVALLKQAGAVPFLVPAMGSHGGATPEGQLAVLAGYGITEPSVGAAVRAGIEVEEVGRLRGDWPVWCSGEALHADAVVLVNRVKPHTDFTGRLGSGLTKMLVVGLGKPPGAAVFHRAAARQGHETVLRAAAAVLLARLPLLAGVATVEDARHRLAQIEVVEPGSWVERDEALCVEARARMPRLPVTQLDLLIVDRIGKNLSGTGLDPAVIGRSIHGYVLAPPAEGNGPYIQRVVVRELTPESHGNAIGIGLADFTTSRLVHALDRSATWTNALTALSLQGAKVPMHFDTDREVLAAALASLPLAPGQPPRVARIRDTLSLEWIEVSESLLPELEGRREVEICGPPRPWSFDAAGNLTPWAAPTEP